MTEKEKDSRGDLNDRRTDQDEMESRKIIAELTMFEKTAEGVAGEKGAWGGMNIDQSSRDKESIEDQYKASRLSNYNM